MKTSWLPYLAMASIFVIVNAFALLFVGFLKPSFVTENIVVYSDPNSPSNILPLLLTMFGFTGILLLLIRKHKFNVRLVSWIFIVAVEIVLFQFFIVIFSLLLLPNLLSIVLSVIVEACITIILLSYPEWYVIDAVAILIAIYTASLMGISLGVFVVLLLLSILAVYDAISVYKTRHMIDFASLVVKSKMPLLLFIPTVRGYSLIKETTNLEKGATVTEEKRRVFLMGLGDFIFPSVLAVSSFYFISGYQGLLIAVSVLLGTLLGYAVLMTYLMKGKAQAGLPFLNSGAILGYLVSTYLLLGRFLP